MRPCEWDGTPDGLEDLGWEDAAEALRETEQDADADAWAGIDRDAIWAAIRSIAAEQMREAERDAADPMKSTGLTDLLRRLQAYRAEIPVDRDTLDLSDLPAFGGATPANTNGIWSWDATSLLIGTCIDDMEIIPRVEHYRVSFNNGVSYVDAADLAGNPEAERLGEVALGYMDDAARELAHSSLAVDVSPGAFIEVYMEYAPADLVIG